MSHNMKHYKVGDRIKVIRKYQKYNKWESGQDRTLGKIGNLVYISDTINKFIVIFDLDGEDFRYCYDSNCLRKLD